MSDEINVISRSQTIIVDPTSSSVSVLHEQGPPGPQGPEGPAGPSGPAATNLVEWAVFAPVAGAMAAGAKQVIGMTVVHKTAGITVVGTNKITVAAAGRYRITANSTVQMASGWIQGAIDQYRAAGGAIVETAVTVGSAPAFGLGVNDWIFDALAGDYFQISMTPQVAATLDSRSLYTIQKLDTGPQGATGPQGPAGPPHPSSVAAVAGTILRGNADLNIPSGGAGQVIVVPTTLFQTGTDTEKVDVAGFTYQIKILTEGLYHINGYVRSGGPGPTAGSILGIQVNGIMIKRETFPVSAFAAIHMSTEAYLMVGDLVNMIGYSPSGTWTSSYMAGGNALDPTAPTLEVWRIAGGPKGDKGDQGGPVIPSADVLITPTLLNGWTYFGSPYTPVSYYKDQIGIVRLRGMIQHASNRTLNMFTLPTGYVPSHTLILAATSQDQTASVRIGGVINEGGARTAGMVYCAAAGNISLPATAGWVSLDGISFRV